MPTRQHPVRATLVAALLLVGTIVPCGAHHAVLRFNLEEMVATADRIFLGRCVGAEETTE